ncbi:MAG TPA: hypothetical protein VFO71_11630 [Gemmatimonadales bacterium]|nr:hypothetical protein [Gemmatimonadales bacterium]
MATRPIAITCWLVMLLAGCGSSNESNLRALREETARLKADSAATHREIARLKAEVKKCEGQKSIIEKLANKGDPGVWTLELNDPAGAFEPRLLERYPADQATAKRIVTGLNLLHRSPGLDLVAQRAATVYVRVKDPEHLTQRMGTTGARVYLGSVVVSLTSLPEVELVHFDFPEGDHATPGFFSRAAFISCC